ncbi:hypothetical protein [Chamaesiphon minutus]|uniref:Uncharacterized protein n=1 Tax=Chamaesiphon minutus (strain ATCC 27169 / PCC 6605) TaxID=1173020 RepID=K9UQM0_CHAP6|nr:hypothetical protein [Chamaesiphon minutus]AFY96978.1 hypothetical protein Cha6605_6146 [Chamaesiphon minutus PCC 6605]
MYFHNDTEKTANAEVARSQLFDSRMISLVQPRFWRIEHLKDLKWIQWFPTRDRHEVKAASFRSSF